MCIRDRYREYETWWTTTMTTTTAKRQPKEQPQNQRKTKQTAAAATTTTKNGPVMAILADHLLVPSRTDCLTAFMWPIWLRSSTPNTALVGANQCPARAFNVRVYIYYVTIAIAIAIAMKFCPSSAVNFQLKWLLFELIKAINLIRSIYFLDFSCKFVSYLFELILSDNYVIYI